MLMMIGFWVFIVALTAIIFGVEFSNARMDNKPMDNGIKGVIMIMVLVGILTVFASYRAHILIEESGGMDAAIGKMVNGVVDMINNDTEKNGKE
jgi:hypothetical protein